MTKQEAFNKALFGVRAQGGPAMRNGACLYYDEATERRCGIGQCLTRAQAMDLQDELEAQGTNFTGMSSSFVFQCCLAAGLPDDQPFNRRVQAAHDHATLDTGAVPFEEGMRRLAEDYGLDYTPPEV